MGFVRSAKEAGARRQTGNEHLSPLGAAPDTAAVLRGFLEKIESYQPREMTLEEFETLSALTACLLPGARSGRPDAVAAFFDRFLHDARREHWTLSDLPPNVQNIRAGLQLLNYDALTSFDRPFGALSIYQREALLVILQTEGDAHWTQLAAGTWYADILTITTGLLNAAPEIFADAQTQRTA